MAVGSAIAGQVGLAAESVFGTGVTVTRFLETDDWEAEPDREVVEAGGLAAGLFGMRASRRVVTYQGWKGKFSVYVITKGFGLVLRQLMGSTATPVQQGATAAYLSTHTFADLLGVGATIQAGEPSINGTVNPYTYTGSKLQEIEFNQENKAGLKMATSWDIRDRTEATGLASASFSGAAEQPFHWGGYTCKVANTFGAEAAIDGVTKSSVKIARGQELGRAYANDAVSGVGRHKEPILNSREKLVTGVLGHDFVDKTIFRDRFANNTGFSLVQQWTGDQISGAFFEQLTISTPRCFLDNDPTSMSEAEILRGDFPWTAYEDGTNPLITITYMSTDTAL